MSSIITVLISLLINEVITTFVTEDICSGSKKKLCLIRDNIIYDELWKYYAGYLCYYFNSGIEPKYNGTTVHLRCNNVTFNVYGLQIHSNGTQLLLDFENDTSMSYINNQFTSETSYQLFIKCNQDSLKCCQNSMTNENVFSTAKQCPVIWDAWMCFPQTPVNSTGKILCNEQYYGSFKKVCGLYSEKRCSWNDEYKMAEWVQSTDYSTCNMFPVYERRYNFQVIALGVCLVFCLPAIVIFFAHKKLRTTIRVILHRNLLIAICVRCMLTILSKKLIYMDALKPEEKSYQVMQTNGVWCRLLTFLESSSINCIYGCMFLDAFYLHKVIVRAFAKEIEMKYIYTVLAGLTFVFSICWAIAMAVKEAQNCWLELENLQWIMDGFRITVLLTNSLLLVDIIRVMVFKLKHGTHTQQTIAAFRATIFLIPLFGLHIIVTAKKFVYDNSCKAEDLYDYFRYAMEGLQGIIVSIIFCYANNEVQIEIKNNFRKFYIYLNQKFGWNMVHKKRATTATLVPNR